MPKQKKFTYVCDYDGLDSDVVYDTEAMPAGWYTNKDSTGVKHYWHDKTHATNGTGGVLGGIYSGGLTVSFVFTDDYDATVASTSDGSLPSGWQILFKDEVAYYFKNLSNTSAWIAANP